MSDEKDVNKCERCFVPMVEQNFTVFFEYIVGSRKLTDKKKLCVDCFHITQHASSPSSWKDVEKDISYSKVAQNTH